MNRRQFLAASVAMAVTPDLTAKPKPALIAITLDLEMSRHLNPGITSVATPRYEVGAGAMTLLRDAIADRAAIQTPHIRLGVELKKRGSTRRG